MTSRPTPFSTVPVPRSPTPPHPDGGGKPGIDPTADLSPDPKPVSAEQVLLSLIKSNKADSLIVQGGMDEARERVRYYAQEHQRLDAIRIGLDAALMAARSPASVASPSST